MQEVLSCNKECFMQEDLSPARGSVSRAAVILVPCKRFYVLGRRVLWFYARGSVYARGSTHPMQGVLSCKRFCLSAARYLPISCKRFCLWSSSILGPMQVVLSSYARGSVIRV